MTILIKTFIKHCPYAHLLYSFFHTPSLINTVVNTYISIYKPTKIYILLKPMFSLMKQITFLLNEKEVKKFEKALQKDCRKKSDVLRLAVKAYVEQVRKNGNNMPFTGE